MIEGDLLDIQALDIHELEVLRARVNARLHELRPLSALRPYLEAGVYKRVEGGALELALIPSVLSALVSYLSSCGLEWHALDRWQWSEQGQICFWLCPVDHTAYNTGWFTIPELIAWAVNCGPVMVEEVSGHSIGTAMWHPQQDVLVEL